MEDGQLESKFKGLLRSTSVPSSSPPLSSSGAPPPTETTTVIQKKSNWDFKWMMVITCIVTFIILKIPNEWWDTLSWSKVFSVSAKKGKMSTSTRRKKAQRLEVVDETEDESDQEVGEDTSEHTIAQPFEALTIEELNDEYFQPLQSN
jgi:hypothetical protein